MYFTKTRRWLKQWINKVHLPHYRIVVVWTTAIDFNFIMSSSSIYTHTISTGWYLNLIISTAWIDRVITRTTINHIISFSSADHIIPITAINSIITCKAVNKIIAIVSIYHIISIVGKHIRIQLWTMIFNLPLISRCIWYTYISRCSEMILPILCFLLE